MKIEGLKYLNLRISNKYLRNPQLSHFYTLVLGDDDSYNSFIKELNNATCLDMSLYYYCRKEYIGKYVFVIVQSGRTSALEASNTISNYSNNKLKDIKLIGVKKQEVLLVFKKEEFCNKW